MCSWRRSWNKLRNGQAKLNDWQGWMGFGGRARSINMGTSIAMPGLEHAVEVWWQDSRKEVGGCTG